MQWYMQLSLTSSSNNDNKKNLVKAINYSMKMNIPCKHMELLNQKMEKVSSYIVG